MNTSAVACFLSAARTCSFSDTAKELHLTRQAVSKNIQEMEKEVGYPLFHRHLFPLMLTTAGAKLYDYYYNYDFDLSSARRIFGGTIDSNPHLRLGWGTWNKPGIRLLDALQAFSVEKHVLMGVVQGSEKEMLEHLRVGEVDAVFMTQYTASFMREPYTAICLSELPMRLGIARNHPLLKESEGAVEHIFRTLPYLACWSGEGTEDEVIGRVDRELAAFQILPPRIDILPNPETVFLQVMLGNGVSCSPDAHIYGYGVENIVLKRTVSQCLVWLNRNTNPAIYTLRDWLIEEQD